MIFETFKANLLILCVSFHVQKDNKLAVLDHEGWWIQLLHEVNVFSQIGDGMWHYGLMFAYMSHICFFFFWFISESESDPCSKSWTPAVHDIMRWDKN